MADIARAKRLAQKRLEQAETELMVQEQSNEAETAQRAFIAAYMSLLDESDGLSPQQKRFLAELALSGLPSQACFRSGTPPRTYYTWLSTIPDFRAIVDETKRYSADKLEQTAVDLATGVYMRPLVSQGKIAAYERIYDTKALLTLLKARKPQEFAQRIDVTSNGHSLVKLIDKDTWDSV